MTVPSTKTLESLDYNLKDLLKEGITIPQRLPFLEAVCWQNIDVQHFTPAQMLQRYEQGWEYRGVLGSPSVEELRFVKALASQCVARRGALAHRRLL